MMETHRLRLPSLPRDASHSPSDSCSTSQRKFEKNVAETLFHSIYIYILSHVCLTRTIGKHTTPFYVRHAHPSRGLASCNTCHIIYVRVYRVTCANVTLRGVIATSLKHEGQWMDRRIEIRILACSLYITRHH